MKCLFFIFLIFSLNSFSQADKTRRNLNQFVWSQAHPQNAQKPTIDKPAIDTSIFERWPTVISAGISDNGVYVSYNERDRLSNINRLVIKNMSNEWIAEYKYGRDLFFTRNNEKAVFQVNDTIFILTLGKEKPDKAIAVNSKKRPIYISGEWLAYETKDKKGELVVLNLLNGNESRFSSVIEYLWEDHGKGILFVERDDDKIILKWVDLPGLTSTTIWSSDNIVSDSLLFNSLKFDKTGEQLTFVSSKQINNHPFRTVWYFRKGTIQAVKIANDQNVGRETDLSIIDVVEFSANGRWLFLRLQEMRVKKENAEADAANVDIYSYKDFVLQSQQLKFLKVRPSYLAVVSVSGGHVLQLEYEIDGISQVMNTPDQVTGDYIVRAEQSNQNFPGWRLTHSSSKYFLVSLKDGKKSLLRDDSIFPFSNFSFSTEGRWLIYFDSRRATYWSYDIQTKKAINITNRISGLAKKADYVNMFQNSMFNQVIDNIRWMEGEQSFLLYDMYDIFKIDPSGRRAPVNITNGFGKKNHILLRLVNEGEITSNERVLVTGFNEINKQNGFYKVCLSQLGDPELLTMGPYSYYRTESQLPSPRYSLSHEMKPVKAPNADAWIISRESAGEYPNYFYTRDWKKFTALTQFQPQKNFNWLTTELVTWKQLDGTMSQGILYKPENFDSKKKYPLIFNYYEHLSYRLFEFPNPDYTAHNINIPWFVSKGYLIFTPDIHYSKANSKGGKTVGEAVYNSVISAAKYLSTLKYVDSERLGLQGHSFGGGETNYLVTHSNLFAAACSAGGTVSDQISAYLGPYRPKNGFPNSYRMIHSENGHDMIGATLWERPDLYFRSSSVFTADRVTTPLLLMHNEKDEQTDWGQSFELYMALRRMGKPVWLLQYDDGGHILIKTEDRKDFTIRLTQFFDHYLKGAPAPVWMTRGMPAKLKTIDQGYELDLSEKKP